MNTSFFNKHAIIMIAAECFRRTAGFSEYIDLIAAIERCVSNGASDRDPDLRQFFAVLECVCGDRFAAVRNIRNGHRRILKC